MAATVDIEDAGALLAYLRGRDLVRAGETAQVRVLAGGVSNRTVWVGRAGGEAWVLKQALAKLRVAVDWFSSPERIRREALGMRYLRELAPEGTIVRLLFEDPEQDLLAMEAVPEPHDNWKSLLLAGRIDAAHVTAFGTLLGTVHRRASERAGELATAFADRSFFESLRLEPYYLYAAERAAGAAPFLRALVDDTRRVRDTLVHGDFSPKNVLVHGARLVLLDHEVIHFGDGAFDVGFALAHLLSKAHHLPRHRAAFASASVAFWEAYARAAGPAAADRQARAARHGLGCLLARVDGRSPLEYLDDAERARQRAAVLALVDRPPATVAALAAQFLERV
jgi:tRNA A-37 threonylcarbamoyl transferase component Bud32